MSHANGTARKKRKAADGPDEFHENCAPERPVKLEESDTPDPPPPIRRIVIDSDGDLVLRAGDEPQSATEFLVCTAAMSRASTVWKRMLSVECQRTPLSYSHGRVVSMPRADPKALTTLLHIVHSVFSAVPSALDIKAIYNLLILTDRYDVLHVVRPWAPTWLQTALRAHGEPKVDEKLMAAYITLTIGAETDFHSFVMGVAWECRVGEDGRLRMPGGRPVDDFECIGPHDVPGILRQMREKWIQTVFNSISGLTRETLEHPQTNTVKANEGSEDADPESLALPANYLFLGSLWHAMHKVRGGLLPVSAREISESPEDFINSLHAVCARLRSAPDGHRSGIIADFAAGFQNNPDWDGLRAVSPVTAEYFVQQRRKLGFGGDISSGDLEDMDQSPMSETPGGGGAGPLVVAE